ncbi:MAG: hypothetical protein PHQ62_03610 [Clostridia bacterium]|nr:hypothetical protein [Clostridia bacterium]
MSFYINNCNQQRPSCINPSSLNNICEKVLIEVQRVFDACVSRIDGDIFALVLTNFTPPATVFPLTYISATTIPNNPATVTAINVDRTDCRGNFANVTLTIEIPLQVSYTDANGVSGTAESSITITRTATLCVPQDSLTPIEVIAVVNASSTIGTFTNENTVNATMCIQIIIKVVGLVDLLVPTFGYPCLPICQPADNNVCVAFFNQPIYPQR